MKIALIGATGNVGQRVTAEALRRGHEVIAIARDVSTLEPQDGVTPVQADLNDKAAIAQAIAGADAVVLSVRFQELDVEALLDALKDAKTAADRRRRGLALRRAGPAADRHAGLPRLHQGRGRARPRRRSPASSRRRRSTGPSSRLRSSSGPGERTGNFRLGKDELLTDAEGKSHISYEDYAIALLDEIEQPQHSRQRFTVGY